MIDISLMILVHHDLNSCLIYKIRKYRQYSSIFESTEADMLLFLAFKMDILLESTKHTLLDNFPRTM